MSQRVSRFIRRGIFNKPYVPPVAIAQVDVELPQTGETPFDASAFAAVPSGNVVFISIPPGFPADFRYQPDA